MSELKHVGVKGMHWGVRKARPIGRSSNRTRNANANQPRNQKRGLSKSQKVALTAAGTAAVAGAGVYLGMKIQSGDVQRAASAGKRYMEQYNTNRWANSQKKKFSKTQTRDKAHKEVMKEADDVIKIWEQMQRDAQRHATKG